MDIKLALSLVAAVVGNVAFFPYIRDIFSGKTEPHVYTWLVWALTQGTATAALFYGGGGIAGLNIAIGTVLVVVVFIFSIFKGTKNIIFIDKVVLFFALLAIFVWWKLSNPYLAVFMVSVIDAIGYIPSIRKSYLEPWSETMWSWAWFALSDILALLALKEFNFLTATYLITITIANTVLFAVCYSRRRFVSKVSLN